MHRFHLPPANCREGSLRLEGREAHHALHVLRLQRGERVERVKYGVDEDVCNGDHACIRLSGCPTLTLKDNPTVSTKKESWG